VGRTKKRTRGFGNYGRSGSLLSRKKMKGNERNPWAGAEVHSTTNNPRGRVSAEENS